MIDATLFDKLVCRNAPGPSITALLTLNYHAGIHRKNFEENGCTVWRNTGNFFIPYTEPYAEPRLVDTQWGFLSATSSTRAPQ
jgi:hypothetical protein